MLLAVPLDEVQLRIQGRHYVLLWSVLLRLVESFMRIELSPLSQVRHHKRFVEAGRVIPRNSLGSDDMISALASSSGRRADLTQRVISAHESMQWGTSLPRAIARHIWQVEATGGALLAHLIVERDRIFTISASLTWKALRLHLLAFRETIVIVERPWCTYFPHDLTCSSRRRHVDNLQSDPINLQV